MIRYHKIVTMFLGAFLALFVQAPAIGQTVISICPAGWQPIVTLNGQSTAGVLAQNLCQNLTTGALMLQNTAGGGSSANTTAIDTITLTVAQIMGAGNGGILTGTPTAAANYTLPLAASVCNAMAQPSGTAAGATGVGGYFDFFVKNTSGGANTITIVTNTGWTLLGGVTIAQNNIHLFRVIATNGSIITPCTTLTLISMGASSAF